MKEVLPGIYLIGKYSLKSFGNSGYFVVHEGGNILVDAPELTEEDSKFITDHGGLAKIFITHIRAFGDACNLKTKFGASLIMHEGDARLAKGCTPDSTFSAEQKLYDDVTLIPTPGYTPGSSCMLLRSGKGVLFCGDMFWWGNRDRYSGELMSWPTEDDKKTWNLADGLVLNVNLLDSDISKMKESAQTLLNYEFDAILMSHPNYPPRARGPVLSGGKNAIQDTLNTGKMTQFSDWMRQELKN
ncbi:MAG: hypothetical protein KIY11_08670 [Thermoplasmata archaeon]|nr:hypothetical protein [Candidatus Sysuiplasma acidicola]